MAVPDLISIPGNIKQHFIPFVLKPTNPLHTADPNWARSVWNLKENAKGAAGDKQFANSTNYKKQLDAYRNANSEADKAAAKVVLDKTPNAQKFSFLPEPVGTLYDYGRLSICPNSLRNAADENFSLKPASKNDISYKSLYYDGLLYGGGSGFNFDMALCDIPKVQVREYLQDAKINQILGVFSALAEGFAKGKKAAGENDNGLTISDYTKIAWETIKNVIKDFPDIANSILNSAVANDQVPKNEFYSSDDHGYAAYVLKIPYLFYYRLMSAFTTNIYEFPYNGDACYNSNGHGGWESSVLGGRTSNESIVGKILNFAGANLNINTTPVWKGGDTSGDSLDISFDLFNDTEIAAVMNMIFVNTLLPGNMWMQYHMFQHASNLYDVRLDGFKRMFMCSASFDCTYKGVMRRPSEHMKNLLRMNYFNPNITEAGQESILANLRIPDVYSMKLNFKSLLPNNFNNFIYNFAYNNEIEAETLWQSSAYGTAVTTLEKEILDRWDTAKETMIAPAASAASAAAAAEAMGSRASAAAAGVIIPSEYQ